VESLAIAVPVFLASGLVVVIAGVFLARYGDEIADRTGWGTLWVGTILVSMATSLPELSHNISAVVRQDNPELALGDMLGSNMVNIFIVSVVAIIFGVRNLFADQTKDTQLLVLVSIGLGILAMVLAVTGDYALGWTSVGGLVMIFAYLGGMKLVYDAGRPDAVIVGDDLDGPSIGAARSAFLGFGVASVAIIIAAILLAACADSIADATGLGGGFMGILAVSIVTSLPEASVTIAAARRRSYGLVLGNIYGSCAFNLSVIFYADLGNPEAILSFMKAEHFVTAGVGIGLMAIGYGIIHSFKVTALAKLKYSVYAIPPVYIATLLWVFVLAQN
jgi:cation:H+ antiporter